MSNSPGAEFVIDQLAYVVFVHMLREQISSGSLEGPLGALSDPRLGVYVVSPYGTTGTKF